MSDQELLEDGKRWRALDLATGVGGRACASCEMVNDETEVDPMTCAVVPWDVLGDSRSFAFVCDGCARAGESETRSYLCEYIVRVTVTATDENEALKLAAAELRDYESTGDLANECDFWEISELDDELLGGAE